MMITPYTLSLFIYNLSLLPVIFFSVLFLTLSLISILLGRKEQQRFRKLDRLPFVSVQIPTFNDPIAERCVRKCMEFDYPKDRYEIIIADDSTNINTQNLLRRFAEENPELIKYIHRENRNGFKPGALKNAMKITKGEILVIFDADWIPGKDFLEKIIRPFSDKKIAIVQTRQGFYNKDTNLITRFASYTLMIYHTIVMPINNRINCVFFCGTAGAIRRSAFEEVGGWNLNSITEDFDLSVKLLSKGYKTTYLDFETPSEVPDTFEGFIKQQMRWCYGNARVFFDNASNILFKNGLSSKQKAMVAFVTLANIGAPFVVIMTIFGFSGWFLGEPSLFKWQDIIDLSSRFAYTGGFFLMGAIALFRLDRLKEFGHFIISALAMGLVLAVSNSIAFMKAIFNIPLHWHCTPKTDNSSVLLK